jgi:hypothetical protein
MWEGSARHNKIQRDEEVQEMVTSPSNLQDQQSTWILSNTSMVDAFHEETVTKVDDFTAKTI